MYEPVFAQPPQSWREWWSAVRKFAAGWYDVAAGEVSGYDPEVASLERPAGVSLPPSIHEWAAFAADLRHAGVFGRAMRDDFTLGWDEDCEALTLLTLGEGDVCWAVHEQYLGREDPPVDLWRPARMGVRRWEWWREWTPTTSQFALQHLIAYLHPAAGGFHTDVPPSHELDGRLRNAGRTSVDLGGQVLIEDDDLVILAGKSLWSEADETGITIQAAIGPARTASIPQVLVELARRGGGMYHGAFLDLRN